MVKLKKQSLLPILGLDRSRPAEYIEDRATANCQNIAIDRETIQKRLGSVEMGDPNDPDGRTESGERILAYGELYDGENYNFLRIGLTKVDYFTGDKWYNAIDPVAGTQISAATTDATALTAASSDRVDTALPLLSGSRILVFTNGVDYIQKWTGSGSTISALTTTAPLAKYCVDYNTYLVLGNITSGGNNYSMRVQWSDTGDPTKWSGGNAGAKDLTEDGKDVTGLSIFGNYLCIHKETCIYLGYLVNTSAVFKFDRKPTGVGTVNFSTIQNLPTGDQAFLARDGIHLFNGISAPLIGAKIMDDLREGLNSEYLHKCWSVLVEEENEYWVAVPIGDQEEADTIYKYNYMTGKCHQDARTNITTAGKYTATSSLTWADQVGTWQQATGRWDDVKITNLFKVVVFGDTSGVSSKRIDTPNDISTAIDSFWESKDYQAEEIGRLCRWSKMQLFAKGDTVKIEYSTDSGSTWSTIETVSLGADYPADSDPDTVYFDVVSTKIRFRFSNSTLEEQFNLKQFIVWYSEREMV